MSSIFLFIITLLAISLFIALVVIKRAWSFRNQNAGKAFLALMTTIAWWLASVIMENISPALSSKIIWLKIGYFGITLLPIAWLLFTLFYVDKSKYVTGRNLALLAIIPIITLVLVWTNDSHQLIWSAIWLDTSSTPPLDSVSHGNWFWLHAAYSYVLILAGTGLLLNLFIKTSGIYRKQVGLMFLATFAPWLSNILFITGKGLSSSIDTTPLAFTISGGVFFWGFSKMKLLKTMPVAYETIFRKMSDSVIIIDSNNRIIDLNLSAQMAFNLNPSDSIGKPLEHTLPECLSVSILNSNQDPAGRQISLALELTNCFYELSVSPIVERNQFKGRIILLHDNTAKIKAEIDSRENAILEAELNERKKAEKALSDSELRLRTLSENSPVMICNTDLEGNIQYINRKFEEVTLFRRGELLGQNGFKSDLFCDESLRFLKQRLECRLRGTKSDQIEVKIKRKDGEWTWISLMAATIQDNDQAVGLQLIAQDITESKRAKEELEKANTRLKELDKLKDNLLSTVSHELRTPLSSIKSFAEILLTYEEDRATQIEFLSIINSESERLTRLINDFLDLSKIQAGSMQWKTTELSVTDTIKSALSSVEPLVQKARLELFTNIDSDLPLVMSDRDKLIQVITNLLGNAIKFTPEGGKITLMAWSQLRENLGNKSWVTVNITDSGIGIAPEHHHKIFENFGQVGDVLKDRPKGTGLGLPICKKIVENYGGKIWVESALGKGTSIFFTLPVAKNITEPVTEASHYFQSIPPIEAITTYK
jgi:PAS domain S-box-containing protein